jgi:hypothetical protein
MHKFCGEPKFFTCTSLSLSLSLCVCRHNGLYRAHSITWKGSSFKLVLGKFFPSNEEPPVLVLNNKLELFFSSILFPHLNGIKEPVLGPVHKKKFQLQHVPDPVPSPTLLEASQPWKMYIIMFIHECWFGIYHLLVSIKNQKRLIVLRSKSADTSGIHGTDRNF